MSVLYHQCRLTKMTEKGQEVQISWLPKEFSVEGRIVDLTEHKNTGAKYRDKGWLVSEVYPSTRTHEQILERSQDFKRTRKASDI